MANSGVQSVPVAEGRQLAYYEFGAAGGLPCVYTPGWPSSGLLGEIYDEAAREIGVRWISVDKPGFGHSDYDPHRALLRYAADIAELADRLGLERFAVAGESFGGPHALAVAHTAADRVTVALVLAGLGPVHQKWVRAGMRHRWLAVLARRAPWLLRVQMPLLARTFQHPGKARRWQQSMMRKASPADQRAWQTFDNTLVIAAGADAFSRGSRAAAQEMTMLARPWGFALSEITCPVEIWHGTEDTNIPVAVARGMLERVPGCCGHILEGEGHALGAVYRRDVMRSVVRAAQGPPS